MADQKITQRPELTSIASDDVLHVVDVSDVTDSPEGTSKKITRLNLLFGYLTKLLADNTYLGKTEKAADSNKLDNLHITDFIRSTGNVAQSIDGGKKFTGIFSLKNGGGVPQIELDNGTNVRLLYRSEDNLVLRYNGVDDGIIYHSGNKIVSDKPVEATAFKLGAWEIETSGTSLVFKYNGVAKQELKSTGGFFEV
jgi:hypothetical protein